MDISSIANVTNLMLAVIIEIMMVYAVWRGYASWRLVLFPGLHMTHTVVFYIAILILEPGLNAFFTSWSGMLRTHALITIILTMLVYWYERFRNRS